MKIKIALVYGLFAVIFVLAFAACQNPVEPIPENTTGYITGRVIFTDNHTGNNGITISLERTNGLLSASVVEANRNIAKGARSIGTRFIVSTTQTAIDGSFTFTNIPAGTYTLYASSQNSLEKAITRNVNVLANQIFNAGTLNLTPVGSISGQIIVQSGSRIGFLVSVAGTSFMAMTDANGDFTISDIPAGMNYSLMIMRGNYMGVYSIELINITVGENPPLATRNITNNELLANTFVNIGENGNWFVNGIDTGVSAIGTQGDKGDTGEQGPQGDKGDTGEQGPQGKSIIWRGEHPSAVTIYDPQLNDAYFNTTDGNAYIWNGLIWELLTLRGTTGANGVSIIWRGASTSHPANPQLNWAYFNNIYGASYIYDGTEWQVLATIDDIAQLTISNIPKTGYTKNFPFTSAGLILTARYTDGSVATIHSGYNLYWKDMPLSANDTTVTSELGDKTIIVEWRGRATFFTITVADTDNIPVTNTDQWNAALSLIRDGGNNKEYVININGNVGVPGSSDNTFGWANGISVMLKGNGKLYLTSRGNILSIEQYQTLYIDSVDLTLEGLTQGQNDIYQNNTSELISIGTTNAKLELLNGTICGNSAGGVSVNGSSSSFTMTGGTISGNFGNGVNVSTGSFTMTGGTISGNSAGGGVSVNGSSSSFTMTGGTISDNFGNGVNVSTGSFTMTGGTISGNNASGVILSYRGSFTMTGGTISGNSGREGGGVRIEGYSDINKSGGIIYGNDALNTENRNTSRNGYGHAVYLNSSYIYYRDTTLGENDDIKTNVALPANSGETLNGWTKQ